MIKISILVYLLVLINQANALSFGSSEIDGVNEALLPSSISNNEFKEFKKYLGDSKSSPTKGKLEEGFGHYLLGLASGSENGQLKNLSSRDFICKPNFVEYLLIEGAKISNEKNKYSPKVKISLGHITSAIKNLCIPTLNIFIKEASSEDLVSATLEFNFNEFDYLKNDSEFAPKLVEITSLLGSKHKELCKDKNTNCKAYEHLKSELLSLEKLEKESAKEKAYSQTKEGQLDTAKKDYCDLVTSYQESLLALKEEKEKSKISGVADLKILKNIGDKVYNQKKEIDSLLKENKLSAKTIQCSI